jgi:NAD(P)H-hydrate epimerase
VLAGLIGGLLAQGLSPGDAARCALFVGARAGRIARDDYGALAVVASDVIDRLGLVTRTLVEPAWG